MEKRKFTADKIPVILAIVCIFGIVGGGCIIRDASRDAAIASANPQVISLPVLLSNGPGKNAHVTITGLQVAPEYVTYIRKSHIENAFYLVSTPVTKSAKPNYRMLADLTGDVQKEQFDIPGRQQLTGIFHSEIPWGTLGDKATDLIHEHFPAVALDHCAYLEIRRYRGDDLQRGWLTVQVSGTGLACFIILIVWLEGRRKRRLQKRSLRTEMAFHDFN